MRHVVIFARRPQLGKVKTRLAADIGAVETLRFYRRTLAGLTRRLGRDPRWRTWIGATPDSAATEPRVWAARDRLPPLLPQGGGDLGERMTRMLAAFGPYPALIVGSDIPDIAARHVAAAFTALRTSDFVFGPADDGGYWLVGAKQGRRALGLFDNVRWSGLDALADTLANVPAGARTAMLETLSDIDDGDTYRRWRASR